MNAVINTQEELEDFVKYLIEWRKLWSLPIVITVGAALTSRETKHELANLLAHQVKQ